MIYLRRIECTFINKKMKEEASTSPIGSFEQEALASLLGTG